jgi:hypothetical protein
LQTSRFGISSPVELGALRPMIIGSLCLGPLWWNSALPIAIDYPGKLGLKGAATALADSGLTNAETQG